MRDLYREPAVARRVRTLLDEGATGSLSDGELLERFASRGGEAAESAFASLVERHGPMVLRACRSILRDPHEAQDAFQAAFLLLARRAGSLWVRDSLAPWLHSVACRISAGARTARGRRRTLERRAAVRASRTDEGAARDDLGPALHEEIERLPERLRAPLVLCYLEGLTHERAAEHLGCPVGTVRSRLARGRERLRRGLARRGFEPPSTPDRSVSTSEVVPPALAGLTIRAARLASDRATVGLIARWLIPLTEGAVLAMSSHPLRVASVLLISAGAIATGLGVTSGQEPKDKEKPAPVAERKADEERFEAIERRLRELELKLELVANPRPTSGKPRFDEETATKIRGWFDNALVEKVFVRLGQSVKKGDPLFQLKSADLAVARNDARTKFVQWDHDHKFLVAREPLAKEGRITQLVWTDTQNDEKKSRLDYLVARDKLATCGMSGEEIDRLLEGLGDDRKKGPEPKDDTGDLARMTVVSPMDGVIFQRDVAPGNFYDRADVLLTIGVPKP